MYFILLVIIPEKNLIYIQENKAKVPIIILDDTSQILWCEDRFRKLAIHRGYFQLRDRYRNSKDVVVVLYRDGKATVINNLPKVAVTVKYKIRESG